MPGWTITFWKTLSSIRLMFKEAAPVVRRKLKPYSNY